MCSRRTIVVLAATLAWLGCSSGPTQSNPVVLPTGDVSIVLDAATKGSGAFSPNPFSRSAANGTGVTWVNGDFSTGYGSSTGTAHQLVSDAGLFDSGQLSPLGTYAFTFPGAGTYAYHCSIHPSMVGTITITP